MSSFRHPLGVNREGLVFAGERPVADQPLEALQVILIRLRHVAVVPRDDHGPLAVALGVDHGVPRPSGRLRVGLLDLGDPLLHGGIGPRKRIDPTATVMVAPGCSLNKSAYSFSIAARPWMDCPDSSVYSASGARGRRSPWHPWRQSLQRGRRQGGRVLWAPDAEYTDESGQSPRSRGDRKGIRRLVQEHPRRDHDRDHRVHTLPGARYRR